MTECPFATFVGSPNFGHPRGTHGQLKEPLAIVDHIMQGTFLGCRSWFNDPDAWASSTFGISKDGLTDQYVSLNDTAWANGAVNKPDPAVAFLYEGHNPNFVTISVEHEGYSGEIWTEAMYQADLKLKRWLLAEYPSLRARPLELVLVGHHQIDSVTRAGCPGPTWPKERLIADLRGEDMAFMENDRELLRGIYERSRKALVKMVGKPEVYEYNAGGGELVHQVGLEIFNDTRHSFDDVQELPADHPIWRLRVVYPGGIPAELR